MDAECPSAGEIVLFTMPADWRPDLGIRSYPAIVLYPANELTRHLDVVVFTGIEPSAAYRWVPPATETSQPGTWEPRL